ncbi:MAG: LysM peptidoglycan-binding domain-containing protein [Puniceicoccaceae bacterium]
MSNERRGRTTFPTDGRLFPLIRFVLFGCLSLFAGLAVSCSSGDRPVFEETDEPDYQRGKRLLRQGEPDQALLSFLRVIDRRTDSPESHLEVGLIYLEEMNQPVLAIYHFMKFLELRPDARQAPEVENLIDTAKKEFARTLPGRPFEDRIERIDTLELLERLRRENDSLKARIAVLERENRDLRERTGAARSPDGAGERDAERSGGDRPAVYVVRPGDTLSSISRTVLGDSSRWEEVFQANRDLLRSPNDLRVGQELRVPSE